MPPLWFTWTILQLTVFNLSLPPHLTDFSINVPSPERSCHCKSATPFLHSWHFFSKHIPHSFPVWHSSQASVYIYKCFNVYNVCPFHWNLSSIRIATAMSFGITFWNMTEIKALNDYLLSEWGNGIDTFAKTRIKGNPVHHLRHWVLLEKSNIFFKN